MLRRLWERNFMAMEYLRSRVHPYVEGIGPQQILDYYEKHPDDFHRPDSVQWQDLFIVAERYPSRDDARRFAEELAERTATAKTSPSSRSNTTTATVPSARATASATNAARSSRRRPKPCCSR